MWLPSKNKQINEPVNLEDLEAPRKIIINSKIFGECEIGEITYKESPSGFRFNFKINGPIHVVKDTLNIVIKNDSFGCALYGLFHMLKRSRDNFYNDIEICDEVYKAIVKTYIDVIIRNAPTERHKSQILFKLVGSDCEFHLYKEPINEIGDGLFLCNLENNRYRITVGDQVNHDRIENLVYYRLEEVYGEHSFCKSEPGLRLIKSSKYGKELVGGSILRSTQFAEEDIIYDSVGVYVELSDTWYGKRNCIYDKQPDTQQLPEKIAIKGMMSIYDFLDILPKKGCLSIGRVVYYKNTNKEE